MKIDPVRVVPILYPVLKIWYSTLFIRQVNFEAVKVVKNKGQGVIFALWHDELFAPIDRHKNQEIFVLVSESRDGELMSNILKRFGYLTIRGSSTRGGVKALKQILLTLKDSPKDIAITVDGPLGPRHIVKQGIIYIAWKLKRPIVPLRTYCSFKKVFSSSWDGFQLPLPFSRCSIVYGFPYMLTHEKITTSILEEESKILKSKLDSLKPENIV